MVRIETLKAPLGFVISSYCERQNSWITVFLNLLERGSEKPGYYVRDGIFQCLVVLDSGMRHPYVSYTSCWRSSRGCADKVLLRGSASGTWASGRVRPIYSSLEQARYCAGAKDTTAAKETGSLTSECSLMGNIDKLRTKTSVMGAQYGL